jgi:hypothetical protein
MLKGEKSMSLLIDNEKIIERHFSIMTNKTLKKPSLFCLKHVIMSLKRSRLRLAAFLLSYNRTLCPLKTTTLKRKIKRLQILLFCYLFF